MAFHFTTTPSWWRATSFAVPYGIFYVGEVAPSVVLADGATATGYTVRDYWGTVVSSGSFSGTTCTPTVPAGGWRPGWYRIQFTGPQTHAFYGNSYGATNFVVLRPQTFLRRVTDAWPQFSGNESRDQQARAVFGYPAARLTIGDTLNLATAPDSLAEVETDLARAVAYWTEPAAQYQDPARQGLRSNWVHYPGDTVDLALIPGVGGSGGWLRFYVRTAAVDGATTFVQVDAGTSLGSKVTVRSPNSATIVETFDNLADSAVAVASINAGSSYVKVFSAGTAQPQLTAAVAIGSTRRANVAAVTAATFPQCQRFEGPSNESAPNAEGAHRMMLFRAAVKEGHPDAIAIGPCYVSIRNLAGWRLFLAAGGGDHCDEIATHAYNTFEMGTITGRPIIDAWLALLAEFGQDEKVIWETESCNVLVPQGGVYCPRDAAFTILQVLIWEQYGVPRERVPYWYDRSHGFWSYPAWFINNDNSINPQAVLHRVLVEETWGMLHDEALSFGPLGDRLYVGSVYRAASGAGTCVLIGNSSSQDGTVTLTVTGTSSPLTVVDALGNTSTATVTGGRVTVHVKDAPVYLRLPAGVDVAAYTANAWPPILTASQVSNGSPRVAVSLGGALKPQLSDGTWLTDYVQAVQTGTQYVESPVATGTDEAVVTFTQSERVDRVIVFGLRPPSYNGVTVPISLAVDTSPDGTTWTQRWSYTNPTASSVRHPTATFGTNCTYDSWFDRQWIFDAPLGAPVNCKAIRVRITQVSVGSEADADTGAAGNGFAEPRVMLQEITTMCDANTVRQYVIATP